VARIVREALEGGAAVERIAIAYPSRDERTLVPLRQALGEARIVFQDALGAPPSGVPVVAAALHALSAVESLERQAIARVLRSGYVDAPRVLAEPDADKLGFREAERLLARLARSLETRATLAGADPVERLVRTAAGPEAKDDAAARRVIGTFARARGAATRGERVRAARALFGELGFGARAGRGALATFARDEAPTGVDRAERLALARDVRAWEMLEGALDLFETASTRSGAEGRAIDAEFFRLELTELLDASARLPGAGRAGAVRVTRLADVAGDELDLLVVVDVNDGVLPRDVPRVTLISEALETAVARAARDSFVAVRSNELAARDLAALATCAAEAGRTVLVTTSEDAGDAPSAASRVFTTLERAGVPVTSGEEDEARSGVTTLDVIRRVGREHTRESFFLDPARRESDVVGNVALGEGDLARVRRLVEGETGIASDRALAVTSIERFAQCAFKGYAHVVLGAREPEEQRELPDAREEGNLGHTALAAAFQATRDEWPRRPRDGEAILTRGLAAADAALAESEGHAPLRAIVRLRIRESVRAVLSRGVADEEWNFVLAEQGFGNAKRDAGWPPFRVRDAGAELWLRGSIDRVDKAQVGSAVRVIDYKRSKSTVRGSSSHLGDTALQVPIYAAVAAQRFEAPATGTYLPMQPRDLATEAKSSARAEERVSDLVRREAPNAPSEIERRVLAVAEEARSGRFSPLPARETECTFCSVSGGCRKPRFAMAPEADLDDGETP
jgi:RecB family exonuclease